MPWTAPVTHAVNDFIDAIDWNDEITGNMTSLSGGRVATTAATATAAIGANNGLTIRLRCGATPFEFIDLTYDSTYAKWVSDERRIPVQTGSWGVTGQALSADIPIGTLVRAGALPWKTFTDAGLKLQLKVTGVFGAEATGATNANYVQAGCASANAGGGVIHATNYQWATSTQVSGLAAASSGTVGTMKESVWGDLGSPTVRDYFWPAVSMFQAGTGSANFYADSATVSYRWVV